MKILLITTHMRMGGIGVYTVALANCLCKAGNAVFVASAGGELEARLSPDVGIVRVPLATKSILSLNIIVSVFKLIGLIRTEKIEMMHAQTRVAQFTSHLLSGMTGVPYVATWHGFYRPHFFRRILPCWGERTIAISKTVYENLKEGFKRHEGDIRLIHNGVEVEKFSRAYSEEEKLAIREKYRLRDGPVIGIIARLSPEKGHFILLDSFRSLLRQMPDAQLMIIGEGQLARALKARAAEYGITGSAHFFGKTLNPRDFLAIMDVFARPGLKEGFGLAIAEAMLMGVPVVSTDVGGFKDTLKQGEFGVLVEPGDAEHLTGAILRVLTDKDLTGRIKAAAKRYAESNFSAERMAKETLQVYKEVLNEKGRKT